MTKHDYEHFWFSITFLFSIDSLIYILFWTHWSKEDTFKTFEVKQAWITDAAPHNSLILHVLKTILKFYGTK